ncbi:MAG: penicillin-binding protein, partial [Nocardioidaceae bacterium]|nr:penicillin-binding protein [Nocardioidaceae bacterium]
MSSRQARPSSGWWRKIWRGQSRAGRDKAPKPTGSGKNGKVRMRDLTGWAKARHAAAKTAKWALIAGVVGALGAAIAVYVTYQLIDIPDPNEDFQAQTSTVYYSDGRHVLGQFALQNRESIPIEEVPDHVQDAVIAAENRSFRSDEGVDPKGIVRAAWHNLRSESTEGASTITQQYVKILYLTQERSWERKIKEAFIAVKIQNQLSKDQILEGYLNTIYFGRGAYGVEAAAHAFFDKQAKDLTVPEGAVLATVLNSPGTLDPDISEKYREPLLARYRYVLNGMADMGNLDSDLAERYGRELPKFPEIKETNAYGGQKGYLMTLVEQQLIEEGLTEEEINGGGLTVITTLNWEDMRAAGQAVKEVRPNGKEQLHVALASIEPGTGALRAMIGGKNYLQSQINWAIEGAQPGSSFKAFALAAALRDGFTLTDTLDGNSPYVFPDGTAFENQGNVSYGTVSLATATENSINTAYIDLTTELGRGPEKIISAAAAAGVPTRGIEPETGVALGGAVVPTVEMAEGYATFAAGGEHADWYLLEEVSDPSGLLFEHQDETDTAFSPAVTSNITYALEQVIDSGSGTAAKALRRPAAGKTGTATSSADSNKDGQDDVSSSWFVGYTPQLATAVMYVRGDGNDALDGYLEPFYGGAYPAETWTAYMAEALAGEPIEGFPAPAELQGEPPTYVPPTTSYEATYDPPETTYAPPETTYEPPAPTTTYEPPETTEPETTIPPETTEPETT